RHPTARDLADELDAWLQCPRRGIFGMPPGQFRVLSAAVAAVMATAALAAAALVWKAWSDYVSDARGDASAANATLMLVADPLSSAASAGFVGNSSTGKYHFGDCPRVQRMAPEHRVALASLKDAHSRNFKPCEICHRPIERDNSTQAGARPD